MRIAYLINQYPAMSHTFIRREIQALESQGHVVERFSIRYTGNQYLDPADKEELKKTHILLDGRRCLVAIVKCAVTNPLRLLKTLRMAASMCWNGSGGPLRHFGYLAEACHLVCEMRRHKVEHLHAHFGTNSTTVALLSNVVGGPAYSFTVHGPEEFDRPLTESLGKKIAYAKFVVAISSFGKSQLQRWCPVGDWNKIKVVRCGLSADYTARPPSAIPYARRFVCVARLSEQKGLSTLLDAFERLAHETADVELVVVGDGPLRSELAQKTKSGRLEKCVRFVGPQSGAQVQDWLDKSRCLVLPSFAEGLPIVIMEAFACARPVISTYVAGIPELVSPEQNGWLVSAGNVDELVEAMRTAIATPVEDLFAMGMRGRARVLELHDADVQAVKLARLFTDGGC